MKQTAAGLAALGRGPDSMLVHMSPREVEGLQHLAMAHGGSLTTNPHTGLPEAGFLDKLLPTIIGAGLMMIPGVNAVAAPWMIGAGVGGIEALRTGDIGKGLMAGLGAFGGAGLGNALGASGALEGIGLTSPSVTTPATTMGAVPGNAYLQSGVPAATDTAASQLLGGTQLAAPPAPFASATEMPLAFPGEQYLPGGPTTYTAATPSAFTPDAGQMSMAPEVTASKPTFMQALGQQFDSGPAKAAAGIGAIGALGGFKQPRLGFAAPQQQPSNYRAQAMNRRPYDPERNLFTDYGQLQPVYAAKGGAMHSVPQLEDGGFVLTKKAVDGLGKGSNDRGQRAAAAGLGAIPIKGPGTGTSDDIPTTIDGVRPAKVSNGEAYVPSKRVKQAGGAKKLYALMRKAEQDAKRRAA